MKLRNEEGTLFIPDATIAKDLFITGLYEKGFINWAFDNFAKEDKEMIDIGAHVGMYTTKFATRSKRVHSFECSPKSFNFLCANLALHDMNYRVKTYNVALSDKEGSAPYLIRAPTDGGGNGISAFACDTNVPTIEVPTRTLDSYGLTNINFIKMDVEGHEEFVLRGALKTLEANNYPKILFESWPARFESRGIPAVQLRKSLFDFLESLGYNIITLGGSDDMFLAEYKKKDAE